MLFLLYLCKKSPSDFVGKATGCAAEQVIHAVVDSALEVCGIINILGNQLAVRTALVIICHHIAAIAQLGADAGGLFRVCRYILDLFDASFNRLGFDFSDWNMFYSFHGLNDTPFHSFSNLLYHKSAKISTTFIKKIFVRHSMLS